MLLCVRVVGMQTWKRMYPTAFPVRTAIERPSSRGSPRVFVALSRYRVCEEEGRLIGPAFLYAADNKSYSWASICSRREQVTYQRSEDVW